MKKQLLFIIFFLLVTTIGFAQNNQTSQPQLIVKPSNTTIQNPPTRVETPSGHYEYTVPTQKQYIILETSETVLTNQIQAVESAILLNPNDAKTISQLNAELKALRARLQYVKDNNLN